VEGHRPKWLFPVAALSQVYRAKFRDGLQKLFTSHQLTFPPAQAHLAQSAAFGQWLGTICEKAWGVYAKRPFAGPEAVLAYVCRYTHRVAISNSRIRTLDAENGR
jgi:hypothetical protein